ncbi:AsmA family protein, partial [Cypionkella sp.]|uniref:AsmA family protein n=1 Tax=Cypionkella sp. TaxID=2811411 RepID=UPI002FDCDE00
MRWIVRTVFALIFVVVLAVGALFAIPTEKIASLAVSQFNALTGRDLVISGAVRPSFYPTLGVQTGPISVSNANWSSAGPMLSAQALSIGLDARALIAGEVKITSLQAIDPKIVLERSTKGQENWVFGAAAAGGSGGTISTQTPGVGSSYSLDQAMISGGEVVFIDHAAGTKVALSKITARASLPSYTGPASFDLTAQMNGQDFSAKGRVDGFQDFLDGKVGGAALDLSAGAAQISFQGRAGWAGPVAEGNLQADLADLRAISALAGIAAPQMPAGLGQRAVQLAGAVTLTQAGSAHLRGGSVVLDGAKLSVDADYTPGARAKISAKVVAGALNLASASGGAGGGAGGGAQAQGWPQDRIDLSALSAMDADISFSAQGLDLGMVKLGAVQAVVRLDNARLVMDVAKAAGYGGTMAGNLVVNGRNGVSVAGDL